MSKFGETHTTGIHSDSPGGSCAPTHYHTNIEINERVESLEKTVREIAEKQVEHDELIVALEDVAHTQTENITAPFVIPSFGWLCPEVGEDEMGDIFITLYHKSEETGQETRRDFEITREELRELVTSGLAILNPPINDKVCGGNDEIEEITGRR